MTDLGRWRQWIRQRMALLWVAVPVAIVAGAVVGAWSSTQPPTYLAETHLLLPRADGAILTGQVRLVEASSELARNTADEVAGVSADEVLASLSVTRTGSALTIAATGRNAVVVRDIADAHAASYLALTGPGVLEGAEVIRHAETPIDPLSPRPLRDAAVAAGGGFIGGGVAGIVWRRRRDRVRTGTDLRGTVPVLGEIPLDPAIDPHVSGLPAAERPDGPYAEAFRDLCSVLDLHAGHRGPRRILVTSIDGGEGKSLVAANLAWVAASQGMRTILVSGDARRPRVGELLAPYILDVPGHHRRTGVLDGLVPVPMSDGPDRLATAVAGDHVVMNIVPTSSPDLYLLPALPGASDDDPGVMLGSGVVGSVLDHLDGLAHVVVIDSPALSGADDAEVLASHADDVILVAAADSASRHQLQMSMHTLNRHGHRVRGVVVNRVRCRDHSASAREDSSGHDADAGARGAVIQRPLSPSSESRALVVSGHPHED